MTYNKQCKDGTKIVIKWGLPIFTIFALVLLVLKLTGSTFSWWWVPIVWCFPFIVLVTVIGIILSVLIAIAIIALVIVACALAYDKLFDK